MSDAGEIIGRLKLDASDWLAKIEEAKGEAESLKAVDPKIQVTADTASAIAGLSAVSAGADKAAAAQARLDVAQKAATSSMVAASIARMRLNDLQDRGTASTTQLVAAMDAVRRAEEKEADSKARVIAATDALAAARKQDAEAALKEAAAADLAGNKTTDAAKGAVPWMGILVGSIAAVSPGIVAVGAAAVGLSGELTGLGAVGVLAFLGIRKEIAAGSDLGTRYSVMLDGLESGLSTLEQTAARGIFTGMNVGVKALTADMPVLNSDVALLSGQLGGMLATSAHTAVTAINGFRPVLVAGGAAFQGFLSSIDSFTASNGFTQFIDYTVARLPDVMHLIDSTLGAVGGIFTALAPAGQSTLFLLSSLMDLLRALAPTLGALMPTVIGLSDAIGGIALVAASLLNALGPVGPALIGTTAAFIGLGFAARALAPAVLAAADAEGVAALATRGLGAAVDFAMGPIGLAVIATGLLASALVTMGDGTKPAAAAVADLTSALQEDNGVVGTNTKSLVANALASSGAFAAASKLGISAKTLTDASTGQTAAITRVNAAVKANSTQVEAAGLANSRFGVHLTTTQVAAQQVKSAMDQGNAALKQATDSYNKVAVASGQAKISMGQMAAAAAAVHMSPEQYAAAAKALGQVADKAAASRAQMVLAGDAANLLKLDLDKLNGVAISNAEAQAAWASGLDSLKSSFNSASKAVTGNSRAAIENRGAVASLAANGQTAIESYAGLTHSVSKTSAEFKSMRSDLIQQVVDMGNSRKAATALVDQYFKMPKHIKTAFEGDDRDAKAKAAAAKKAGEDFAKGDYKAALKADPATANRLIAQATSAAEKYAKGAYEAKLRGDAGPATTAAQTATVRSRAFAREQYLAHLNAVSNAAAVAAAARAALNSVHSKEVYLTVFASVQGNANAAQIAKNAAQFGANGGTTGSPSFGSVPHLAGGGTITGAGTAFNDRAGLYALANGEEVVSNVFGGASGFRGLLKRISAGEVRTPQQAVQALGAQQAPQPVTVIVQARDGAPDFTDYIDVRVVQGLSTQQAQGARTVRMGRMDRGLLAGA